MAKTFQTNKKAIRLSLAILAGLVLGALTSVSLAKKFGKTPTWGILYLFVLFFIGWVMIAVTNMTYNKSAGHQKDMSPFQMMF